MGSETSRRAFVSGAGLLVSAALACTASSSAASSLCNPRLSRAIALHDRVGIECDRFDTDVEMPARQAWAAALASHPVEPEPPHEQSVTSFVNAFGDTVRLSTANIGTLASAERVLTDPTWADIGDDDWRQAHREIAAAGRKRNAVLAEQAGRRKQFEEGARAKFRIDAIYKRSSALADRRYILWRTIIAMPAASLSDLVTKLGFIDRTTIKDELDSEIFDAISADIRRLAGEVS